MKLSLKTVYYQNPVDLIKENYKIIKRNDYIILEKTANAGDKYEKAIRNLLLKTKTGGPGSKSKKAARNRYFINSIC